MTVPEFHEQLFQFQPYEVVAAIFDYFAAALNTAPPEKQAEFFVEFRRGVMTQMKMRLKGELNVQQSPNAL